MSRGLVKTFKCILLIAFSLALLGLGVYLYLVLSFDTQTLPELYGEVSAVLYAGQGEEQPLIVGLGGAEGGNTWTRSRFAPIRDRFLEQGYAFLALGYFGGRETPARLDRIAVEGVAAAILEAASDPRIDEDCIAVVGGSSGGVLALLVASHTPAVKAVVGIVPGSAVFPAHTLAMSTPAFALDGEPLPFVPVPWGAVPAMMRRDLRAAYERMLADREAVARAAIPVEDVNGPVLLLSATGDEFWPSTEMSEAIVDRLREKGFPFAVEHVAVEGGHQAPQGRLDLVEDFLEEHILRPSAAGCPR